uniref:Uncharacterized protein n=1 Tax=Medicago truncatula TaxID=3880 RepID=B7FFM8_MEDTR|nr:unknown [Medicago truncatula]
MYNRHNVLNVISFWKYHNVNCC